MRELNNACFKSFPELQTPRLRLRALQQTDVPVVFRLYSDSRIMRYRGAPVFTVPAEAEVLINQWSGEALAQTGLRWGIELQENKMLIGTAGFTKLNAMNFRAEIGYELDPGYWNRGLMTEALRAITGWCMYELNLHTIEANIAPENAPSKRVLEKLGFEREALFRENYYFEGWWDSAIYTLHEDRVK